MILSSRVNLLLLFVIFINGCAIQPIQQPIIKNKQTIEQRNTQLSLLNDWQLIGKIAFIQAKKRESASISWKYKQSNNSQKLDLNSYLGINVLHLESKNDIHTIEVDGKSYQSKNLDQLITSLTGLTLPTEALSYWLKGLAFHQNDTITYDEESQLPLSLTSEYNNERWQITYANYRQVKDIHLATKFTIQQNNLIIRISVKKWII